MLKYFYFYWFLLILSILASCDEENPINDPGSYRLKEVLGSTNDESSHWHLSYDGNKIYTDVTTTTRDAVNNEIIEYEFDDSGNIISRKFVEEESCTWEMTYDYSQPLKIIRTITLFHNYPACEIYDVFTSTYFFDEDNNLISSIEDISTDTQLSYRYDTENGNIVARYNTTPQSETITDSFAYDLNKKIPDNIRLLNGLVSGNSDIHGKNLIIERHDFVQGIFFKNEYEFDSHGNITKVTRYSSVGDNQNYTTELAVDLSYEPI